MIDAVKDYLAPKTFRIFTYVCVIVHSLCGLALSAFTTFLRISENAGKFFCLVDGKSTATYKKQVDQVCFARYDQAYNSPLPLCGFVPLSIGVAVLVSVIYSLIVSTRVDEIESRHEQQTDGETENCGQNRKTEYVFYSYFVHLVLRGLFLITLTVLHHTYLYPNGFDFKFSCNLPPADRVSSNINTPKNASRNLNVILGEVIYLLPRFNSHSGVSLGGDSKFVIEYLLGKQYNVAGESEPLTRIEDNPPHSQDSGTEDCIDVYKEQVLNRFRDPSIIYGPNANIDELYIDVVIHTGRAQHNFSEEMERHEIYDVYMKVPLYSICLEKIDELFYPNRDTKGKFPRSILVIGRPGIGKTVLTEKIIRDWANGIDEYYSEKIVFFFKFRWFNENNNKLKNISLKTFLQFGTGLSEEKFESIYEEIAKEPQKAIFIFDGLDEYHGEPISCLDQSRIIPNDPNTGTSAIHLFIKLVLGDLLKGATVVVTSRPTADGFYSRLDFDRNVEIIGFTSDKIEEYVSRFCDNNNTNYLTTKIWNHVKSSSELLNLCYIPVNCFIVCVTLSGCLSDPRNETDALPTTLTELYQTASDHFEKHHRRNADRNSMAHEALKKLQRLAFLGMKSGQLVFNQTLFDEEIKKSGLLNSLSNPIFPLQTQFCFIHLTIQEFLAAGHVTETFTPAEIKKFISDHVESGQWHLVLQFIAGLLGKKIKNFDREYKDCVFAFAESLEVTNDRIEKLKYHEVFIMKCLKEVDNEEITKEVCEATAINDLVELVASTLFYNLSPSEWAAVIFVCKHMKNLANLELSNVSADCLPGLLRKRCLNKLVMHVKTRGPYAKPEAYEIDQIFSTLVELNCISDHKHTKLTSLTLVGFRMTETGLPIMCNFFENGYASQLEQLTLKRNRIDSHKISKLCEALNNGHCPNLTHLDLRNNSIRDEGAKVLCDTLTKGLRKLNKLDVSVCELTVCCIPILVKALQDERCQMTDLSLKNNAIGDKGAHQCIPSLRKTLQDERCQLNGLSLRDNAIGDEGACMLFEDALTNKHCKLTELDLSECSLTDKCIASLRKALQDERYQLTVLFLGNNTIGDKGACMLFEDALTKEHFKLTELDLSRCLLTDKCIPSLCKTLQDERCQLTVLLLADNVIGDKGACMLFEDALTNEHCKLTGLNLRLCSLTDKCIPSLCKALQDERCQLTELSLARNDIRAKDVCMLFEDALTNEHCKLNELNLFECLVTDLCIPAGSLWKVLKNGQCVLKIRRLLPKSNYFTENGKNSAS
ncbi:NACHT, LRR and PYD domains-containing 14-like [Paramuricea clavata]|uniref:NACHT, LRR and PYD domains-containing 14-like n=1 Tax=Paramuricea clavata TaxID=317549 RepID=A0A6S7H813_PARCT|nr:NACHT, LRR and PYD domains-containing 14-like [Paramuricea clavata]